MAGHPHRPGAGVVDVNPLEAGNQPRLDGLHQHGGAGPQQADGQFRPCQQPIGQGDHLIGGGDQRDQPAHTRDHVKTRSPRLGDMLQRDQPGIEHRRDADHPLAP